MEGGVRCGGMNQQEGQVVVLKVGVVIKDMEF